MEKEDDLIGDVMSYVHGMMDSGFKRNQSLDNYITDCDQVCTNTYWNECYSNDPVTVDSKKSSPRRRFQRKMNEFEYWKSKLKKGCQSIKLSDDVKNMEEMYWVKNGNGGYLDPIRTPLAPTVPFDTPPSVFQDLGFNVHLDPDLDMLADNFLDQTENDSVLGSVTSAQIKSGSISGFKSEGRVSGFNTEGSVSDSKKECGSVSGFKDEGSVSEETVIATNCESTSSTGSLIHDPPWLDLDYLPYDESKDRGFMMEDILEVNKSSVPSHSGTQCDPGANANITNGLNMDLSNLRRIRPIDVGQIGAEKVTISHIANMALPTSDRNLILDTFFDDKVSGTVISPNAICRQFNFIGYTMWTNMQQGTGSLIFDTGEEPLVCELVRDNDLWFFKDDTEVSSPCTQSGLKVNRLSMAQSYELWHQRLAHAGSKTLRDIHHHAKGVPKLKGNPFYRCASCMQHKLSTKQPFQTSHNSLGTCTIIEGPGPPQTSNASEETATTPSDTPGQHFALDWGFMRGSSWSDKKDDKLITSIDGMRCYCVIVDKATRYTWVILSSSKDPPVDAVRQVLKKFRSKTPQRTVRLDQDRALGKSKEFLEMLQEEDVDFTPTFTGTDSSAQNGLAERPHRTLADMVRCMLHSADLGPEYWSFALVQAVWIKNRLPHASLNCSPYEAITGEQPDLSRTRIFGSRIFARDTKKTMKLDSAVSAGRFLGYAGTSKNVHFIDSKKKLRSGHHVIFDEAHMTAPHMEAPLAAQALQQLGYTVREKFGTGPGPPTTDMDLEIQQLSSTATIPTSAPDNVGYLLHSNKQFTILPGTFTVVPTGLLATLPDDTCLRISDVTNTSEPTLRVFSGSFDASSSRELSVVLVNTSDEVVTLDIGDIVAQMHIENVKNVDLRVKEYTSPSSNDTSNHSYFTRSKAIPSSSLPAVTDDEHDNSDDDDSVIRNAIVTPALLKDDALRDIQRDLNITLDMPYDISMSNDPFDAFQTRTLRIFKDHPLLGLVLQDDEVFEAPRFVDAIPGQPAAKMTRWKRELRNGHITHINNIRVKDVDTVKRHIQQHRHFQEPRIDIRFAIPSKPGIAENGQPQLFHDQMTIVAEHLSQLDNDPSWKSDAKTMLDGQDQSTFATIAKFLYNDPSKISEVKISTAKLQSSSKTIKQQNKLTRAAVEKRDDFNLFLASEKKQLDQYEAQDTFGKPQQLPKGANLLRLLWVYVLKDDGTRKARCVCNGAPNMAGSVTLAQTYAAALDQTGARLFWAKSALDNFIILGADASNAFAEAPAPVAPLFVRVDKQYRDWYSATFPTEPPIPKNAVLRVKKALQGHPESPRLWAKLIDSVIRKLNLRPCSHEPNLYYTNNYNGTGKTVLFLRQVDDFAIACEDTELAKNVISAIDASMSIEVKYLGLISRYNGVDVTQTRQYIKISNATYIDKISLNHPWIEDSTPAGEFPIPMISDPAYQKKLESSTPLAPHELAKLQGQLGFTYRQAIGELIYAMVTCRPDISFALTKLAQYSDKPASIHFEAVQKVYLYLIATKNDGILYWRKQPRLDLPYGEMPKLKRDPTYNESAIKERQQQPDTLYTAVDSDHAADTSHRRSVSGVCIKLAGGVVLYKSLFQKSISLSSTEAEFYAAVAAGKYILYIRSIMSEIGMEQYEATTLFEDNQGALLMAQAGKPTKRTKHVDLKIFVLQDWVEHDLLAVKRINTADNPSDAFTKPLARTLFYRHTEFLMGKIIPQYAIPQVRDIHRLSAKKAIITWQENYHLRDLFSYQCYEPF